MPERFEQLDDVALAAALKHARHCERLATKRVKALLGEVKRREQRAPSDEPAYLQLHRTRQRKCHDCGDTGLVTMSNGRDAFAEPCARCAV